MKMKVGARYRSQVCNTEMIVVRALPGDVDLTVGGHPVIDVKSEPTPGLSIKTGTDTGSPVGKRFTDSSGKLELLITKPGEGGLALDGELLSLKETKPLPSSD